MSDRFNGPKLNDLDIKRRAEGCASRYFYLNKGRFEKIDILDLLEFQLGYFAPGFKFAVVADDEIALYARSDDLAANIVACTDPPTKTIYASQQLYRDAYQGDSWSRMCLAHELGHAILHSDYSNRTPHLAFEYKPTVTSVDESKVRGIPLFRDSERQAEIFAAFLLMPDVLVAESDDASKLATLAHVDLHVAKARYDFHAAEKKGKRPSLALRLR